MACVWRRRRSVAGGLREAGTSAGALVWAVAARETKRAIARKRNMERNCSKRRERMERRLVYRAFAGALSEVVLFGLFQRNAAVRAHGRETFEANTFAGCTALERRVRLGFHCALRFSVQNVPQMEGRD